MKQINNKAPVVCRRQVTIYASAKVVYHALSQINEWVLWQPEIKKAKLKGFPKAGAAFQWISGGSKINSIIHTASPYHAFGWSGKALGIYAIHNWYIDEQSDHTVVHVEESMQGLLAFMFRKNIKKKLAKGMENWLQFLKHYCEHNYGSLCHPICSPI